MSSQIVTARGKDARQPVPPAERSVMRDANNNVGYSPLLLGPSTVGVLATSPACLRQVVSIVERLEPDAYIAYLLAYYRRGLDLFGENWRYADITTVLLAAAQLIKPENYLEIGVRRGRSMAVVAATCPACDITGFDLWLPDYAEMSNPGPNFVQSEIRKLGHTGQVVLIDGDSHKTLKAHLREHPQAYFDLITVDGDHSRAGASADLADVWPRLKVGGVLVFDDIRHPSHPYLADVWTNIVVRNRRFATWTFSELGFGVALAIRVAE